MTKTDFTHSSYREKLIEHLFVGEVLKCLWKKSVCDVEVLKAETDHSGYDVVIDVNGIIRHVQLKASFKNARTHKQNLNRGLMYKPSGCVVWVVFDQNTIQLGPFLWFGGRPGKPLPNLTKYPVAKHTKANSQGVKQERPNIFVVPKSDFMPLQTIEDVVEKLFNI